MANIANLITKLSGIIASLDDIRDAISQGGGGSSTASRVSVTPTSPLTGTNLQATTNETAALLQDHANEISALNSSINTIENRRWTFLTAIQANGTYTVPDLSQYKEYQIRVFLTYIRLTLFYDDIANFTTIFPEWENAHCKIQKTNNTTLTVSDSTIATISYGAFFYVYAK